MSQRTIHLKASRIPQSACLLFRGSEVSDSQREQEYNWTVVEDNAGFVHMQKLKEEEEEMARDILNCNSGISKNEFY